MFSNDLRDIWDHLNGFSRIGLSFLELERVSFGASSGGLVNFGSISALGPVFI
jgi:hypothetical protein